MTTEAEIVAAVRKTAEIVRTTRAAVLAVRRRVHASAAEERAAGEDPGMSRHRWMVETEDAAPGGLPPEDAARIDAVLDEDFEDGLAGLQFQADRVWCGPEAHALEERALALAEACRTAEGARRILDAAVEYSWNRRRSREKGDPDGE